ncbi:MAG: J domain-containing protein, partial [Candidatus Syntropharchaeales archaeon]
MTSSTRYDEIRNAADILGLPETATMDAIKKSYRMLMVKWHPDRCKEDPQRCKEM